MRTPRSLDRTHLVAFAALLLPACGVVVARAISTQPATAAASSVAVPPVEHAKVRLPSPAWIERLSAAPERTPITQSPFRSTPTLSESSPEVKELSVGLPPLDEAPSPPPTVRLSAIMKSGQGHLALIDGKAARPGDALSLDWILDTIDAQERTVTLRCKADGRTVVIQLDPPR